MINTELEQAGWYFNCLVYNLPPLNSMEKLEIHEADVRFQESSGQEETTLWTFLLVLY